MEYRFLRTLAASCNVKAACKSVGFTQASAYVRRKNWKAFAYRWEEALDIGYVRLEMALIENVSNLLDGADVDPDAPIPPMTVDQVIQIIGLHRRQVKHKGRGVHRRYKQPEAERMRAQILCKLDIIEHAEAMKARPLPDSLTEEK